MGFFDLFGNRPSFQEGLEKCRATPNAVLLDVRTREEYASGHVVDFALLDIDMPGMDGIQLAQALRRLRSDIIIVFATAHPKFAVEALKMKADYIIFKPFDREDIADVMERAKLLRRRQRKRIHFHTFGAFDMLVDGEPVKLTATELKIVDLLMRNLGRIFPAEEIYRRVWNEEPYSAENTVMVHIRRLRVKIEKDPQNPELIKTVWGKGYRFEGHGK